MLLRTPTGFIEPCLPSSGEHPPTASEWVHEIKHDGYRLIARRGPIGIRLLTRNGSVGAMNRLKVRSCLIDGETVAVDDHGRRVFDDGFGLKSYTQSTFVW
jgi:bifunctional non-homologous end joining protein LigD